jgi:ABC-type multidrug transport system fused ATPase/permease subunit
MAKLPNIIEKDRSLFKTMVFVFQESFKGSKSNSIFRLVTQIIIAALLFVEFGALAIIVNEFVAQGVALARPNVIWGGVALLIISNFLPDILGSMSSYFENTWNDDMSRHLQGLLVLKMRDLDIGTIEQPELQNILESVNKRGWTSFYQNFAHTVGSIKNILSVIIAAVSLVVISPWVLLVIFIGAMPTLFFNKRKAKLTNEIWEKNRENGRIWAAKAAPVFDKNSLTEMKNFNLVKVFLSKWYFFIEKFHGDVREIRKKRFFLESFTEIFLASAFAASFFILIHQVSTQLFAVYLG